MYPPNLSHTNPWVGGLALSVLTIKSSIVTKLLRSQKGNGNEEWTCLTKLIFPGIEKSDKRLEKRNGKQDCNIATIKMRSSAGTYHQSD